MTNFAFVHTGLRSDLDNEVTNHIARARQENLAEQRSKVSAIIK
jgi:hypothetical protein